MPTLYLIEQNTVMRKTSDRILLCRKPAGTRTTDHLNRNDILLELPCADIDQIMLFGNIQVTTQALQKLLQDKIELAIFTQTGKLLGQLTPPKQKNIELRLAQFDKYKDEEFCLHFSKTIVKSKLQGAYTLIQKHSWNHPGIFSDDELQTLKNNIKKVDSVADPESLLGHEGSSSAFYFNLLGRVFKPPWEFVKRTRQPPEDPVNAVLSFGYVVVTTELQSQLDGIGFDPYLGFYHQIRYGRSGLALDLVEEFRHSFIDRLTITLFNTGIMKEDDFYRPAGGGMYMNSSGKRKFFQYYEKLLGDYEDDMEPSDEKDIRKKFQRQIYILRKTVQFNEHYQPLNNS